MKKLISRSFLEPRVQEIGKIKIGGRGKKQKGGKGYQPEKYDHFKVVTLDRAGGDGAFILDDEIHGAVGEKPRELDGVLMFPEIWQNLQTSMVQYDGRTLAVRCDGEEMMDTETGEVSPCQRQVAGQCDCKPYGRLSVQLLASPTTEGYYTFRTTSWETVNNLQSALESIYERFGTLFQAPIKLKMYQSEDVYTDAKGQTMRGRSWKVHLLLNMSWQAAALKMVEAKELLDTTREKLMLRGETVVEQLDAQDKEEAAEIAGEFFPDEEEASDENVQEGEYTIEGEGDDEPDEEIEEPTPEEVPQEETPPEEEADPKLIKVLEDLRDEARAANILDAKAEQFIKDAIESKKQEEVDKVIRALNRRFAQAEKAGKEEAE